MAQFSGRQMDADQVINSMQACVLTVSARGIVTYANRAARESLSLSAGDDLSMRLGDRRCLADFLGRCARSPAILRCRLHAASDASSPTWECRGHPLHYASDAPAEHILLHVERAAALTEPNATAEPDAADLRARELEHRFKNGVQMIVSTLDSARRRVADEAARQALASAMRQVQAIAHVQSLVTRAHAGQTLAAQGFLDALCDAIGGGLAPRCPIRCAASLPAIPVGLSALLALVINELVTNAVKYGASDVAQPIEVHLDRGAADIVLTIADHGPGFVLDASGGGSGLGLVRELVRQVAGSFTVVSQRGTCCIVKIPLAAGDEA